MTIPAPLRTILILCLALVQAPGLLAQSAPGPEANSDGTAREESADMQRLRRAAELSKSGEFGAAERILRAAFEERYVEQRWSTGLFTATDHLIEFLRAHKRFRSAQEIVRSVTALDAPSAEDVEHFSEFLAMLWLEAELAYELTDFEEALEALERMEEAEQEPSASVSGLILRVRILGEMDEHARVLGEIETNLPHIQRMRELEPRDLALFELARGEALVGLGRTDEAETALVLAAHYLRDVDGSANVRASIAYAQARVFLGMGDLPRARIHLEEALELRKPNSALIDAVGDDQVARACRRVENYSCAIAAYERAELLFRTLFGRGHERVFAVQKALADSYRKIGDQAKTISQLREALAAAEIAFGASSETSVGLLGDLGRALSEADRFGEAHEVYRRVIDAQIAIAGPESKEVATALLNHAVLLRRMSRFEEAIEKVERAREIRARILGEDAFPTQRIGRQLSWLYREVDRFDEALVLARQSYEAYVDRYGDKAKATLGARIQLADVLYEMGQPEEAVNIARAVLAALDTRVDVSPLEKAAALSSLAYYLDSSTHSEEKIALNSEALRIREEELGPRHSLVSISLNNLGHAYHQAGMPVIALARSIHE
jgi:tetratricopeptide (TPR) repeat protein